MRKFKLYLLILSVSIAGTNNSFAFSIHKPTIYPERYEAVKYLKVSEFVKLSAKQFSELSGIKMNIWDKVSFAIAKMRMKHDLKKNPHLQLNDFTSPKKKSVALRILLWVSIVLCALLLVIAIIFSGQKK